MKSIGRLGWKLGVAGDVFYDSRGNEWRRVIGAFWWLLVAAALLLGCDHTRNPLLFPVGPSTRDTCPKGTQWVAIEGKCEPAR